MSQSLRGLLAVLLGGVLAACSGGGDDEPPAAGGVTLSGVIHASSNLVIDHDTNDPVASYASNNTLAEAQRIGNPILVGGYVTAAPTGVSGDRYAQTSDPDDIYQVDLTVNQSVSLEVSDTSALNDLDLGLYDANGVLVDASVGVARFENVTAPVSGRYYLRVAAYSGASNYILSVGTGVPAVSSLSLASDFVPGQAVVIAKARAATTGAYSVTSGAPGTPQLVTLDGLSPASVKGLRAHPAGLRANPDLSGKLDTLFKIKALKTRTDLTSADPNYRMRPQLVPNDTYYGYQWHYPLINLPQAWDVTTGTPATGDVVVAVLDTGVRLDHADIADRLLRTGGGSLIGYDFVSDVASANDGNGIDADPNDPGDESTPGSSSWHGTHVAGTIAGASNNGRGIAGVSWGARIMPVRVLGKGGGTSYDIIQGIRYAAGLSNDSGTLPSRKADIINLSLGCENCYSSATESTFDQVRNAGVIVIAAAGNEGSNQLFYPASYRNVVSVSAVTLNRGLAPYSNFGSAVDVAAPGGDVSGDLNGDGYADGVLSTLVGSSYTSEYGFYQGTSMAAPHVAGVAALMKAVHRTLTPAEFDALLANGAIVNDLGVSGRDDLFGHGLIDAAKAVLEAKRLATGQTVAALTANPGRLDLGVVSTTASFSLSKLGDGTVSVSSVSDDADWLSVSAGGVGTDGLGTYTVSVNRAGLAAGSYAANITINASGAGAIRIPVTLQVASSLPGANTGYYWVLLLDEGYNVVAQDDVAGSNGVYAYRFDDVAPGRYYLLAGTDSDRDDLICDDGEACGAYPIFGQAVVIEVGAGRSDLDFLVGLNPSPVVLPAQALAAQAILKRGVRKGVADVR